MKKSSSKSKSKDEKKRKSKNVPEESNMTKLFVLFLIVGLIICLYFIYAYQNKLWPFKKDEKNKDKDKSSTSPGPNSNNSSLKSEMERTKSRISITILGGWLGYIRIYPHILLTFKKI